MREVGTLSNRLDGMQTNKQMYIYIYGNVTCPVPSFPIFKGQQDKAGTAKALCRCQEAETTAERIMTLSQAQKFYLDMGTYNHNYQVY